MAEAKDNPKAGKTAAANAGSSAAPVGPVKVTWKNVWQIPTLVAASVLFVSGAVVAFSNRPKPDPSIPLATAESQVEAGKYQDAIDTLNGRALGFMDSGLANREQQIRFLLARARAFAGAQTAMGISREENHRQIVQDSAQVEKLGGKLDPQDVGRMIESMIALNQTDEVIVRLASLGSDERERRLRLTKQLIERNLAGSAPREELVLELLAALAADPQLSQDDRSWVLIRQSELLIGMGRVEDAITKLLREIQRLRDVSPDRLGELYVLLGRGYYELGQPENASKQLEAADSMLDKSSLLRAEALLLQGRIAQSSVGNTKEPDAAIEVARERFETVVHEFGASRAYLPALLGLAEVEASLKEFDRSLERYSELAEALRELERPAPAGHAAAAAGHEQSHGAPSTAAHGEAEKAHAPSHDAPAEHGATGGHAGADATAVPRTRAKEITRERIAESLIARQRERYDDNDRRTALRFAQMAEGLFAEHEVPAELLLAVGRINRDLGDEILEAARSVHASDFTVKDLDPVSRAEVKRHYLAAGDYFKRHAESVAAADTQAYAESLWTSADSFDLAGDQEEARKGFAAYADGASDTDANKPAAKFRLAQIFQAQNDFASAMALYEGLRATAETAGSELAAAGKWADMSIVPLALCYLSDAVPDNDLRAETLLKSVVDGSLLSPEARDYREALLQLGNMYYTASRFPEAIARYEELLKRYADQSAAGATSPAGRREAVMFKLADSHRLEAGKISKTLATALPQSVEDELKGARIEHLQAAIGLYERSRMQLEAGDQSRLSDLERTYIRNAYFYTGDCAFDLGDFEQAVAAYDTAALKYSDDPASLVAMVQIVNAYVSQRQWAQARTANERARRQLARFPDEVWNRPDLPMEKKHWERWLDARTLLEQSAAADGAGGN